MHRERATKEVWLGIFALAVSAMSAQAVAQNSNDNSTSSTNLLSAAKSFIRECGEDRWVSIAFTDLSKHKKSQPLWNALSSKLSFGLQRSAHPHYKRDYSGEVVKPVAVDGLRVRAYAAANSSEMDLIEYRWAYQGLPLCVVANRSGMILKIDLNDLANHALLGASGASDVARAVAALKSIMTLKGETHTLEPVPFEIDIPWPASLEDGTSFSTNPEKPLWTIDAYFWFQRVDFFVEGRTLSVLVYSKPGQLMSFPPGWKWFDDEFRALVHKKAREQGITPPAAQGE